MFHQTLLGCRDHSTNWGLGHPIWVAKPYPRLASPSPPSVPLPATRGSAGPAPAPVLAPTRASAHPGEVWGLTADSRNFEHKAPWVPQLPVQSKNGNSCFKCWQHQGFLYVLTPITMSSLNISVFSIVFGHGAAGCLIACPSRAGHDAATNVQHDKAVK